MLLRLRVRNHRSIRDEVELSFLSSGFRGATPPDGRWADGLSRVTAIYGANGSGKSSVLDAIDFVVDAVRNSATQWAERDMFPYRPFALDDDSLESPSLYEMDLVVDGVRYTFGFESDRRGIQSEWLYSYPVNRRRILYRRNGSDFQFGRSLGGEVASLAKMAEKTELFISTAARGKHGLLSKLRHAITGQILYARFDPSDQDGRILWLKNLLSTDDKILAKVQTVVGLADLGVSNLNVRHERIDPEERSEFFRTLKGLSREGFEVSDEAVEDAIRRAEFIIELGHSTGSRDPGDRSRYLPFDDESSGTVAWLSLLVPGLHAAERGLMLMIDEIDSSLHPRLTSTLMRIFDDTTINRAGGQLLFTSHDTSLLGKNVGESLGTDQVWFTEKQVDGSTDLYALAEFSNRESDNIEKRYLDGRYGALPIVAIEDLRDVVREGL